MNALLFIIIRTLKNNFLETLRKPAKLIVWIMVIALIAITFISSLFVRSGLETGGADLIWLKGIIFLLYAFFTVISVFKGLSNGDAIFSMADANLLFVSPVDARKILFYGIVQMAKTALLAGFFIFFQSTSICGQFNVGFSAVLLIFLGFFLTVSVMQITSLVIYSLTNGRPFRKTLVKIFTALVFVPLIAVFCFNFLQTGSMLFALEAALRSPAFSLIPAAGWAAEGTILFIAGAFSAGFLFYGLIFIAVIALIIYIILSNPDYYEDVLAAAQTAFEKQRALTEGKLSMEAHSQRKIKVENTGIGGEGASSLFAKHLRESFRSGRLGLWGAPSFFLVFGVIIYSYFTREAGIIFVLPVIMWLQVFLIGTSRGIKELYTHYIYMIPESAFKKIMWSNGETVLKVLVESAVMFTAAGIIMGESASLIIICVLTYTFFSLMLIGINYFSLRFIGTDISAGLTIIIYMLIVFLALLPGLVPAIIFGIIIGGHAGFFWGLAFFTAWELIAACICFAISKSILHDCDMFIVKPKN